MSDLRLQIGDPLRSLGATPKRLVALRLLNLGSAVKLLPRVVSGTIIPYHLTLRCTRGAQDMRRNAVR